MHERIDWWEMGVRAGAEAQLLGFFCRACLPLAPATRVVRLITGLYIYTCIWRAWPILSTVKKARSRRRSRSGEIRQISRSSANASSSRAAVLSGSARPRPRRPSQGPFFSRRPSRALAAVVSLYKPLIPLGSASWAAATPGFAVAVLAGPLPAFSRNGDPEVMSSIEVANGGEQRAFEAPSEGLSRHRPCLLTACVRPVPAVPLCAEPAKRHAPLLQRHALHRAAAGAGGAAAMAGAALPRRRLPGPAPPRSEAAHLPAAAHRRHRRACHRAGCCN